MNKIVANIIFMIITIIIVIVLGHLLFLSNLDNEIEKTMLQFSQKEKELEELEKNLEQISQQPKENTNKEKIVLLSIGQEGQLMKLFLNQDIQKALKINTYDLYSSYFYKPESQTETTNNTEVSVQENLAELDANGMPVNAYVQEDKNEWNGLEVCPVKITFTAGASNMDSALKSFKNFPVNTIRMADFIFNGNLIKGTMVFAFPLNEK